MVARRVAATSACATEHLPSAIRLLHESYDEPALFPRASVEANEVQLVA
jgi:hypothetical protein